MALTDGIFDVDADERVGAFEELYLFKFGRFAHTEREEARLKALKKILADPSLADEFYKWAKGTTEEGIPEVLKTLAGQATANGVVNPVLDAMVAKAIVQGTTRATVDQFGRRAAVIAIEQTPKMAASAGARAAATGIKVAGGVAAFLPGISAAVGQVLAETISDKAGVTNFHAKNSIAVGGAVGGGATVGAMVGGPVGAAAGAVMGVVGWGIGQGINAAVISGLGIFKGPDDNWGFLKTGKVPSRVCFSTWGSSDTLYWKSYSNEYRKSNCDMFVMSAGQGQTQSFQLTVYDNNNDTVRHLDKVFYRDFVHVGKNKRGKLCVAHGKGELWGNEAGTVSLG